MSTVKNVPELFGSMVFNETVMQRASAEGRLQEAEADHAGRHRA